MPKINGQEIAEEYCEFGVEYVEQDATCFVVCVDEDEARALARLLEGNVHVKTIYETDWAAFPNVV